MKKLFSILLSTLMVLSLGSITALAQEPENEESVTIYMSVINDTKVFELNQEAITVTDVNNDNALTIDDAFICAHNAKYPGGAAQGYSVNEGFMTKFWGIENGGSYGYYVNNNMAMGLNDNIKNNDYINAFIYSDPATYSDVYSFFNINKLEANANDEITLKLSKYNFDPVTSEPIEVAVENATIVIDSVNTEYKTDANGCVTIKLSQPGNHTISATSDELNLVPPMCNVTVKAKTIEPETTPNTSTNNSENIEPETTTKQAIKDDTVKSPSTGNENHILPIIILFVGASITIITTLNKKSKIYEKQVK